MFYIQCNTSTVVAVCFFLFFFFFGGGTGIRGLVRGMATLPQANQELLAICGHTQSWKTPGELGVSKSVECDVFPFSALTLLVG